MMHQVTPFIVLVQCALSGQQPDGRGATQGSMPSRCEQSSLTTKGCDRKQATVGP